MSEFSNNVVDSTSQPSSTFYYAKKGFLVKKGMGRIIKPWALRHFILEVNQVLSYYEGNNLRGVLTLDGASVRSLEPAEADNREFAFEIYNLNIAKISSFKSPSLVLVASSNIERESWMVCLQAAVKSDLRSRAANVSYTSFDTTQQPQSLDISQNGNSSSDGKVTSILPDSVAVGGVVTTADIKNMKAARLKMKAEKEKAAAAEKQYKIDMERSTSLQLELLERNRRMAMESANHAYTGMVVDKKSHRGVLYSAQRRLVWVDIFEKTFNWSKNLALKSNEECEQQELSKKISLDDVVKCNYEHNSTDDVNVPSPVVNIAIQTNVNSRNELDSMQIICDSIAEGSDLYNAIMFTKGIKLLDRTTI